MLDAATAERFASIVLACLHREYPNKIAHVLHSDNDAQSPQQLTPAFFGCFDWHSAVHSHWCLIRIARFHPSESWTEPIRAAVQKSFTPANIEGELAYLNGPDRAGFERPYGLGWLLQLCAELREWDDEDAQQWSQILEPLETLVSGRFENWLTILPAPIRTGEHNQTAFGLGLAFDWARSAGREQLAETINQVAIRFFADDCAWPLGFEPSAYDFLSPSLAEADLMRRILAPREFATWLDAFLPEFSGHRDLPLFPATCPNPEDGKLAHLDGLNLSRAWMLEGVGSGLPDVDPRIPSLLSTADAHRKSGLAAVTGEHYAGAHWLPSFAVYLLTGRGLKSSK